MTERQNDAFTYRVIRDAPAVPPEYHRIPITRITKRPIQPDDTHMADTSVELPYKDILNTITRHPININDSFDKEKRNQNMDLGIKKNDPEIKTGNIILRATRDNSSPKMVDYFGRI